MPVNDRAANARDNLRDLATELAALPSMSTAELTTKWVDLFGVAPRSRNRTWLIKRIAWRMQERAAGGLTERALGRVDELAENAPIRHRPPREWTPPAASPRDPRLPPPGTVLRREYGDGVHEVTVLDEGGFDYRGQRHRSLSAVATAITGTRWNGYLFFGLTGTNRR